MNRVILLGYCGDAADQLTGGGIAFSLATSKRWNDEQGQTRERTDWHRVVIFGKRAEGLAPIIRSGLRLSIEGRLRCETYEDRNGVKRHAVDVIAEDVVILTPRDGEAPRDERAPRSERNPPREQGNRRYNDVRDNPAEGCPR